MIATKKGERIDPVFGAVGEFRFWPDIQQAQGRIPGEGPEADYDLRVEQLQLAGGVGEARVALCRARFVLRWDAADGGRDPEPRKPHAVIPTARDGAAGKSGAVERREKKIPGPIARKVAPRPVRPVGSRSQPENHHIGFRIAKPRNGTPPVRFVHKGSPLLPGDLLTPGDQTRAKPARNDLPLQRREFLAC